MAPRRLLKLGKWLMGAALAACLAACNPRDRAMPDLEDAQATAQAGMTLSPWKDGSSSRSPDGKTQGDLEADRWTFFRWYLRWAQDEDAHRLNGEMPSLPVPATMGEAIDQQHAFELKQRTAAAASKAQADAAAADQLEIEADAEANRQIEQQQQAARDAKAAALAADQQKRNAAVEAEQTAAKEAAHQASLAQARQSKLNYQCRLDRQQAATAAVYGKAVVSPGTYQRVWDSYHCREN